MIIRNSRIRRRGEARAAEKSAAGHKDSRRRYKDDTDSLKKMGEALGWRRETVPDEPLRYTSEEGFSGGPGGTHAVKEVNMPNLGTSAVVDAVENVGKPKVTVKPVRKVSN